MKFAILSVFSFVLSFTCCFGQSVDYYVNMDMDTVYGEFSSISKGKIKFSTNGKKKTLDPNHIYRVYHADKNAIYGPSYIQNCIVRIEDSNPKMYKISERLRKTEKPLFAQIHADGEVIVYSFTLTQNFGSYYDSNSFKIGSSNKSDRHYALKKSTNEILELRKTGTLLFFQVSGTKINKNLSDYLDNSPELIAEIEQEPKVNYDFILERIKRYNEKKEAIGEGKSKYGNTIF